MPDIVSIDSNKKTVPGYTKTTNERSVSLDRNEKKSFFDLRERRNSADIAREEKKKNSQFKYTTYSPVAYQQNSFKTIKKSFQSALNTTNTIDFCCEKEEKDSKDYRVLNSSFCKTESPNKENGFLYVNAADSKDPLVYDREVLREASTILLNDQTNDQFATFCAPNEKDNLSKDKKIDSSCKLKNGTDVSSNEKALLSFSTILLNDWRAGSNRADEGRRLCERLRDFLSCFSRIELEYSNKLSSLLLGLHTGALESSGTTTAIDGLRSIIAGRAFQSKELSENIRKDIVEQTLSGTVINHGLVSKQMYKDAEEATSSLEKSRATVDRCLERYSFCAKDALSCVTRSQETFGLLPQVRTEIATETVWKCLEYHKTMQDYLHASSVYVEENENCKQLLKNVLNVYQDMDHKRLLCLKDALMKFLVYYTSFSRNIQYDFHHHTKSIEGFDCQNEISEYLNGFLMSSRPSSNVEGSIQNDIPVAVRTDDKPSFNRSTINAVKPTAYMRKFFVNSEPRGFSGLLKKNTFFSHVNHAHHHLQCDLPDVSVVSKLEAQYDTALSCLWDLNLDAFINNFDLFDTTFQSSLTRSVMCKSLAKRIRDKNSHELPTVECLEALGSLCTVLLDWSHQQDDVWTTRLVMLAAQHLCARGTLDDDPDVNKFDFRKYLKKDSREIVVDSSNICNEPEINRICIIKDSSEIYEKSLANETPDKNEVVDKKETKIFYLIRCFFAHDVWNRVSFWERALVITISEEMQKNVLAEYWKTLGEKQYEKEERAFKDNNPCVGSLASFGNFMLMFGIEVGQVIKMIRAACQRFNLPLDYELKLTEFVKNVDPKNITC